MEQVRWEDSGAVKHLGEAVRLSCTPRQEMLTLASESNSYQDGIQEGKSGKLKLHDR